MLISRKEVEALEEIYDRAWNLAGEMLHQAEEEKKVRPGLFNARPWVSQAEAAIGFDNSGFWFNNPHLIMAGAGFDEFRDLGDADDANARLRAFRDSFQSVNS
ncbi:MAG: hypothetical protein WAM70_17745, partial [Pyrinomonadaceae bacterium]